MAWHACAPRWSGKCGAGPFDVSTAHSPAVAAVGAAELISHTSNSQHRQPAAQWLLAARRTGAGGCRPSESHQISLCRAHRQPLTGVQTLGHQIAPSAASPADEEERARLNTNRPSRGDRGGPSLVGIARRRVSKPSRRHILAGRVPGGRLESTHIAQDDQQMKGHSVSSIWQASPSTGRRYDTPR